MLASLKARAKALWARIEARLVEDYRDALKWSSVRFNLVVIGLNALFAAMPALDPSIAQMLPKAFQSPVIGIYSTIALALRLTKLRVPKPAAPPPSA